MIRVKSKGVDRRGRAGLHVEGPEGRAMLAASVLSATGVNASGHTGEVVPAEVASFTDSTSGVGATAFATAVVEATGAGVPSVVVPDAKGGYDVYAVFPAGVAGSVSFAVAISGDGATASATGQLTVSGPAEATPFDPSKVSYVVDFSGILTASAELDLPGTLPASDFTATVDWGDGSPASSVPLTVTGGTGAASGTTVIQASPTHHYATGGAYAARIAVTNSVTGEVDGAAFLAVPTGLSAPTVASAEAVAKLDPNGLVVAQFLDSNGTPAARFTASINWGDGSPATPGTVTLTGTTYSVSGDHTYASGTGADVPVVVTVTDPDRGTSAIPGQVQVFSELNQRFVAHLFLDLLGRPADPNGLSGYTAELDSPYVAYPQARRAGLAEGTLFSTEGIARRGLAIYTSIVGRAPDPASLADIELELYYHGGSDEQSEAYLYSSPESYAKDGGTDADYLEALDVKILGRPIDSGALAGYESELASGSITRFQVAFTTLTSVEYQGDLINTDFQRYIGRPPTSAEYQAGLALFPGHFGAFESGADEDLIGEVLATTDYFNKP